ncbi:hypothetical protein CSC73_13675 [Pseudoxanthomonas sacheonensis]|nr:hypothetical protein CSC73_13675 [Pseudoxanthomonas sacheonensis]
MLETQTEEKLDDRSAQVGAIYSLDGCPVVERETHAQWRSMLRFVPALCALQYVVLRSTSRTLFFALLNLSDLNTYRIAIQDDGQVG